MIKIVPYRPGWAQEFEAIAAELHSVLGDLALRIDHIGSTAVPGLPAKDIIDIQVTVAELTEQLRETMLTAGYPQSRHKTDHQPPGQPTAPAEWQKLLFKQRLDERPANIHLRVAGRANQRYPLLMRDYLRAFPAVAQAYGRTKIGIVKYHSDDEMEAYYDIKDPVFDIIYGGAEFWAEMTGWEAGLR